jgi:hypothetical protein
MNLNTKPTCITSLSAKLKSASHWRASVRKRYPADTRNARAEEILTKLAGEAGQLTDGQWNQLQPFFNWASEPWNEAVARAARDVEFKPHVFSFDGFIDDLIAILHEQQAAA